MAGNSIAIRCRNCGEAERLQELGFIGQVAPFFLKRVLGVRLGVPRSPRRWKQWVRRMVAPAQRLFHSLNQPVALVEMQICQRCEFIQTRMPFHEEAINRLYLDYREDSYNRERISLEPSYSQIAEQVGHATAELEARLSASERFLAPHIHADEETTILDFGGSDGKFMPRLRGRKFVFEISSVEPVEGVVRLHSDSELGTYSLVQLAHVIEHVVDPLALVGYVSSKVAEGGLLYLETPQELSDAERSAVTRGERFVGIHEHINSYCVPAVQGLLEAAGLKVVAIEATPVDVGWASAVHIRALGQKAQSGS